MSKQSNWWKNSIVYQVYPKSFNDSNNDGVGDIKGIVQKLDYLDKLGIDVIWLNPIFQSPMVDNGYDISDYYEINPLFGDKKDLKELLEKAHKRKIKIILDLVVNHTSDQHKWFLESKKSKDNKYSDYYIWKNPKPDGSAPNNWEASFGGSAWEYCSGRDQYYLHCFATQQPDLNWENPELRESIYQMMRYWLDFGVDGFRLDVISLLSKRQDFPDSPPEDTNTKNYYIGVSNGPRIHEFLNEMYNEVFSKYDIMTVGETPNTNVKQALLYTDPSRDELNMVFQFDHMHIDYGKYGKFSDVRFKLSDLKNILSNWQEGLEKGWNSLYWSNHDQPRAVTRFGNENNYRIESAKMLGTLLHMMKGTPFIFQGEEIGMKNVPFSSLKEYKDVETLGEIEKMKKAGENIKFIKEASYLKSRDNARTPLPWNGDDLYHGFSDVEPWIQNSPDDININIKDALLDENSVFYHYQKLIEIRKNYDVVIEGKYKLISQSDSDVYAYMRETDEEELLVVCSFSDKKVNYTLSKDINIEKFELLLSNYPNVTYFSKHFLLNPYEANIYYRKK